MIVYEATKKQFLQDSDNDDIEEVILQHFKAVTGKSVGSSEINSWKGSLGYMAKVLRDEEVPDDTGLAIELHIPQTSKRIDITLTGRDESGAKNAVLVELKQWSKASATGKDAIVRTALGNGLREVVHPSYQAWSYATLLEGFNEAVYEASISVRPCAYLHNYPRDGVIDSPHYRDYMEKAPLFLKGKDELARLRSFIKQHIRTGDAKEVLYELANGRIRPSKALADSLKGLLAAQPEFVLIDDQKEIYESAIAAARSASETHPRVLIIEGGPGTGKTVVAINLLVHLTGLGLVGKYVSKNAAPRKVYESRLVGSITRSRFSHMFTGSGGFIETEPNTFDMLIVDEAHRLNEKSGLYGNLGENQIKELIEASKCAIFFIDEDQRVTLSDIGSKQAIREFAKAKGATVEEYSLASQFRCNGSDGYLAWLDDVLDIRPTANQQLDASQGLRHSRGPARRHRRPEPGQQGPRRGRLLLAVAQQEGSPATGHRHRRLPAPMEPRPGRQSLDHRRELHRTGRLHPHLPGPGGRLHRRHHRPGPDRPRRQDHHRPRTTRPPRQVHPRLQEADEGKPGTGAQGDRPDHQEHLPDADDPGDEGVLRVLYG